jgi:hypothetical protein
LISSCWRLKRNFARLCCYQLKLSSRKYYLLLATLKTIFILFQDQNSSDDQQEQSQRDLAEIPPDNLESYKNPPRPIPHSANRRKRKNPNSVASTSRRSKMHFVNGRSSLSQPSPGPSSSSSNTLSPSAILNMSKAIGNMQRPIFSASSPNLLMGLTNPLIGSLTNNLENSRHSPPTSRQSPPLSHRRESPPNGNLHKKLAVVDEICYLYPSEDYSLLRTAVLKNEVTFYKLSPPPRRHLIPENSVASSSSSNPSANDFLALQLMRNHTDYLQLLRTGCLPQDLGSLGEATSWLNPFTTAAVAGFSGNGTRLGNGNGLNGITESSSSRKKNVSNDQHPFLSPKAPVSNSKSKTVAAVLAATRNSTVGLNGGNVAGPSSSFERPKRPPQRRKPTNGRIEKPSTATFMPDDDYFDPTSMLEVVTTKPSSSSAFNDNDGDCQGMDLSSTAPSVIQRNTNPIQSTSTLRSKAMNKDYGFLNELGLVRRDSPTDDQSNGMVSTTASLEHFVQNVLSHKRTSTSTSSNSTSNSPTLPDPSTAESSDRTKDVVLEAFNFDSELAGDARGVARKFGLNIRIVQKWIREAPTRSVPISDSHINGCSSSTGGYPMKSMINELGMGDEVEDLEHPLAPVAAAPPPRSTKGPVVVNKRKNPKPNQICDFTEDAEVEGNDPLDMVVPIKKRRVSTPTPTSA